MQNRKAKILREEEFMTSLDPEIGENEVLPFQLRQISLHIESMPRFY